MFFENGAMPNGINQYCFSYCTIRSNLQNEQNLRGDFAGVMLGVNDWRWGRCRCTRRFEVKSASK